MTRRTLCLLVTLTACSPTVSMAPKTCPAIAANYVGSDTVWVHPITPDSLYVGIADVFQCGPLHLTIVR